MKLFCRLSVLFICVSSIGYGLMMGERHDTLQERVSNEEGIPDYIKDELLK